MDRDYFNSLKNSVQDSERSVNNVINSTNQTLLTVKVDIDCKVYCDGDFLDLLEANKTKKFTIETGPHLITIESEKYEELVEDREIDAKGRNNLVIVKDMKQKEQEYLQREKENKRKKECKEEEEKQINKNKELALETSANDLAIVRCSIKIKKDRFLFLVKEFIHRSFPSGLYIYSMPDFDAAHRVASSFPVVQDEEAKGIVEKLFIGENVYLFDTHTNNEYYGDKKHEVVPNTSNVMYTINLSDFIKGLENAASSTYKVHNDSEYVWHCFVLLHSDSDDSDHDFAETLMQIIVFDELIYG